MDSKEQQEPLSVNPGEKIPDSGIFESSESKERATLVRGKKAPPTPAAGEHWVQVVDTNPSDSSSAGRSAATPAPLAEARPRQRPPANPIYPPSKKRGGSG